jgi:excisionase family DNA binding protein
MAKQKTQLVSVATAARMLGVTRQRVWQLIQAGKFDSVKVEGMRGIVLRKDDVLRYILTANK